MLAALASDEDTNGDGDEARDTEGKAGLYAMGGRPDDQANNLQQNATDKEEQDCQRRGLEHGRNLLALIDRYRCGIRERDGLFEVGCRGLKRGIERLALFLWCAYKKLARLGRDQKFAKDGLVRFLAEGDVCDVREIEGIEKEFFARKIAKIEAEEALIGDDQIAQLAPVCLSIIPDAREHKDWPLVWLKMNVQTFDLCK